MSLALVTARITALSSSTAQSPRGLCVSPLNEAIRVGWSVEDAPSARSRVRRCYRRPT